jgi:lipid A 3-O-deacylase
MLIAYYYKNRLIPFIFFILISTMLSAQAGQLNIQFENDEVFATDGNYTNGFSLSWESKPELAKLDSPLENMPTLLQWQYLIRLPLTQTESAWGMKMSQRIWTPNNIRIVTLQSLQRPYAGLFEIESHTADYGSTLAQKNWLALGVTGVKSKAEYVQKKIHNLIGAIPPLGWQFQVEEQVTFQLAYEVDALLFRSKAYRSKYLDNNQWEVSSYSHLSLGNFNTEASAGLLVKWGTGLLNTFGRLSSHFGHTGNTTQVNSKDNFSIYSRFQLGYRFSDLTIEGELPYVSHLDIKHQQARAVLGMQWTIDNYAISWSLNSYTRAYKSDDKSWYSYGSLTLSCTL